MRMESGATGVSGGQEGEMAKIKLGSNVDIKRSDGKRQNRCPFHE